MDEFMATVLVERQAWDTAVGKGVLRDLAFLSPAVLAESDADVVLRVRVRTSGQAEATKFVRRRLGRYGSAGHPLEVRVISCKAQNPRRDA